MDTQPRKKKEVIFKQFTVVYGGVRLLLSDFEDLNEEAHWWTNSQKDAFYFNAIYESLNLLTGEFNAGEYSKQSGLAVRCLKN